MFGDKVLIFSPNDSNAFIQEECSKIYKIQEANQFGNDRYAILFKKGTYDVDFHVGFYTQVSGLGKTPVDTTIKRLNVEAKWLGGNNATCNFWRTVENLTIDSDTYWGVSQAAPMRRLNINGNLALHCNGYASGGFLADSVVNGDVDSGPQQQWISRNCTWNKWEGQVWNMVFVGVENPPVGKWPETKFTTIEKTPIIKEKPFLFVDDDDKYKVFVPHLHENTVGVTWDKDNQGNGDILSIDEFYIAKPEIDTAKTINAALNTGKHLIFTPGIYYIDETIYIKNKNTIVFGLGLATIVPTKGVNAMVVADVDGVNISSLMFDAGQESSKYLLQVGENVSAKNDPSNPLLLCDLFFRVGGAGVGRAEICLEINRNNVLGDNFWIWRADHGDGSKWDENITKNGLVVNGDNVTIYSLMVEHFHEYQTLWNGNNGRVYFYQSELPYDVPYQKDWLSQNGKVNGFASYKVADNVKNHQAWGLGIYGVYLGIIGDVDLNSTIEVPDCEQVIINNATNVLIRAYGDTDGKGTMKHIVNNKGDSLSNPGELSVLVKYCNGISQ